MNKSSSRRVAAVATAATVGGLLLPFLAAGSALAGTVTGLSVNPASAYASVGGTASFTGNYIGTGATAGNIYQQVISGPDTSGTAAACGTATSTGFTCTVTPTKVGVDTVRFFYDTTKTGTYSNSTPSATATLTVSGATNSISLSPATSAAQNGFTAFVATALDAAGRPVVGATINFSASEPNTYAVPAGGQTISDLLVSTPATAPTAGQARSTPTPVASGTTGTVTTTATTASGASATTPGAATFYVASQVVGAVSLSASLSGNTGVSNTSSLTVNPGSVNDVTALTVTPSAERAFVADRPNTVVNLRNAQGNPISGLTPVANVTTGLNAGAAVTIAVTDNNGNTTASYLTAAASSGTDTLQAFVNQSKSGQSSTLGLDSGEPNASATIAVAANDIKSTTASTAITSPLSSATNTVTFTVANNSGIALAGYNVNFALTNTGTTTKLSVPNSFTDANGKVSVTVTNPAPLDGDVSSIAALVGTETMAPGAASRATATVTYAGNAVSGANVRISPVVATNVAASAASFTAAVTDQFGNAVNNVSYAWSVVGPRNTTANNSGTTGSNALFSYTDNGSAATGVADSVTLTVTVPGGGTASTSVSQYWQATAPVTTQSNLDLTTAAVSSAGFNPLGNYTTSANGQVQASGFVSTLPSSVSADPTAAAPVTPNTVVAKLTDAGNNRLFGKSVSFSTSGVGVLTDVKGNPLTSPVSATVFDSVAVTNDKNLAGVATNASVATDATVFARSTQAGTQTITATVDGVSTTATITYSGQYVAIAPARALDTRSGQGGLAIGGGVAPAGAIAPNTIYNFNYATAGILKGQAAYVFNVKAISPSGVGNLRVAPGEATTVPGTSVVNYQAGKDVANTVIVPNLRTVATATAAVGAPIDSLQIFSANSSVNIAFDLIGYYPTVTAGTPAISSVTPTRVADTRTNGSNPVAAGETRALQVGGVGTFPNNGKAVALNVTVVNPGGLGNLRIFADGAALPLSSNINYIPGQDKSAFVIVNLPANGKIDVYSAGTPVDVAIDAYASYDPAGSTLVATTPVRTFDSRPSGTLAAGGSANVQITGTTSTTGVPANAQAVLVSLTAIHTTGSTGSGNLRTYAAGAAQPNTSTLNYVSPTADVANFAIVPLGTNGQITVNTQGSPTDFTVDILGYVPAGS